MKETKTIHQIKREKQAQKDAACMAALAKAKAEEKSCQIGGSKMKDPEFLARYVAPILVEHRPIRKLDGFESKSYSLKNQVLHLVDHQYARYPVPLFLYRTMLSHAGEALVFQEPMRGDHQRRKRRVIRFEQRLFLAAASGESMSKKLKRYLTKKEAHCFMHAASEFTVVQNIFWAKCAAAGLKPKLSRTLTLNLGSGRSQNLLGDRTRDLIQFYQQYEDQMSPQTVGEITDFVREMVRERDFSFKERTLGSMLDLCREWHRTFNHGRIGAYRSWPARFDFWEVNHVYGHVHVSELNSNRAISEEGLRQRHCVYLYVDDCLNSRARIVSFRWMKQNSDGVWVIEDRLTVQVDIRSDRIVQVRGKLNRSAQVHEKEIIRLWAGENCLTISKWAW